MIKYLYGEKLDKSVMSVMSVKDVSELLVVTQTYELPELVKLAEECRKSIIRYLKSLTSSGKQGVSGEIPTRPRTTRSGNSQQTRLRKWSPVWSILLGWRKRIMRSWCFLYKTLLFVWDGIDEGGVTFPDLDVSKRESREIPLIWVHLVSTGTVSSYKYGRIAHFVAGLTAVKFVSMSIGSWESIPYDCWRVEVWL